VKKRLAVAAAAAAVAVLAAHGCSSPGPCGGASCGTGLYCDLVKDVCVPLPVDAGQDAGVEKDAGMTQDAGPPCGGQCPFTTPYCDVTANKCRRCLPDAGCTGSTPVCDTGAAQGLGGCYECVHDSDCVDPLIRCHITPPVNRCVQCTGDPDCVFGACDFNTFMCSDAG